MRILHLTTFLQGGAGLAIVELARAQHQLGHDVAVVTSQTGAPGYGNYAGHLEALARASVPVHQVDSLFSRDTAANTRVAAFIEHHVGPQTLDVIHAHAATPSRIGLKVAAGLPHHLPVVQTMHGWGVMKSESQQRADIAVLNQVDRVVVPAETSQSLLRSFGVAPERTTVVPYGVADAPELSGYTPAAELRSRIQARHGDTAIVLCVVGTIGARKNQRVLVDALPLVDGSSPVVCVFIGDGPADELKQQAAALGVSDRVICLGYRTDARELAATADWMVLPSQSEGQPLSILEAYCDGVPVIASDIPELRELVNAGSTGLLFPAGNATALAGVIGRAIALDPVARRRLVRRARARYDATFSLRHMVDGYMRIYRDVWQGIASERTESWKAS